jgi:TetR/AcrR family transcriptional regulator, mexJK operon transcriptional repressor
MAARLGGTILDVATVLFLRDGYAATSIEAIAKQSRVGKRTFYARFPDKAAVFKAVVERLIADWLSGSEQAFVRSGPLEEALVLAGQTALDVALSPPALGLRRLIIAESARFPELAEAVRQAGAGSGTARIASLLRPDAPESAEARFAARQFMALILTEPLNHAIVSGTSLDPDQRRAWVAQSVHLFLQGWLRTGPNERNVRNVQLGGPSGNGLTELRRLDRWN